LNPSTGGLKPLKRKTSLTEKEKKSPPLYWDDIKDGLTGHARIVNFVNHSHIYNQVDDANEVFGDKVTFRNHDDESLEIKSIEEGRFTRGIKDGYARVLYPDEELGCQLGFFVNGVPKGKHVFYN
jgi:hypothetical protein